jgi:putative ABC transport system substrate-binding protein
VGAGSVAFDEELRKLGWIKGSNLSVERRGAEGRYERFRDIAADLVRLKPHVIVGPGTQTANAVKEATSEIPIVFSFLADAVESGLVQSLARPGGNVTGVAGVEVEGLMNFEILKEVIPTAKRVAVLMNAGNETARRWVPMAVTVAARSFGLEIDVIEVRAPEELPAAIAKAKQGGAEGLVVASESMLSTPANRVPDLVAKAGLPAIYQAPEAVPAGGLIALSWDLLAVARRHAQYVDRVLRGASPADLPIELPTKYDLRINLKTASPLGLTIPPTLLARADEVIE